MGDFDVEGFETAIKTDKPRRGGGPLAPLVQPAQLRDGKFFGRFLPAVEKKCEKGYRRLSTHKCEQSTSRKAETFLCSKGYDPDGCAAHDYYDKLLQIIDTLSETQQSHVNDLEEWVRYLFPVILYARGESTTEKNDKTGKEYTETWYTPDKDNPMIVIFQIQGTTRALLEAIFDVIKENPKINDPNVGHNWTITKQGNHYAFQASTKQSPIFKVPEEEWKKHYPRIDTLFNKGWKKDYAWQLDYLDNSYWIKGLKKRLDAVVAGDEAEMDRLLGLEDLEEVDDPLGEL